MKRPTSRTGLVAIVLVVLLATSGIAGAASTFVTAGAGTTYETDSGLVVRTSVDHGVPADPFNGSDTLVLADARFTASGTASLTVDQFVGTRTNVSQIDASANAITINPDDKSAATVSGGVTRLSFADVAIDGTEQLSYSASSSGTITVTGLAANARYAAATPSGDVLSSGTTTSSGEASISVDAATNESVILLEPDAPVVDNASADPSGGEDETSREITFSIAFNDSDFAEASGDEVTANFSLDGSQFASKTATSNGTVSATTTVTTGGDHNWSVTFTDAYGETTRSDTFAFRVPATLTFRNEQNASDILNNVQVNVTAYYGNKTLQRNTSDGTLNLTGLPTNEPIIIRATGDQYITRTVVIRSIYEQSNVYLLNKSVGTYQVRFDLQDPTGAYPQQDTVLFVERDIELNGSTKWRVIAGDSFGVQGVPAKLVQGERYRLRVRNLQTGATATIGAYTAIQAETVTISPGSATINVVDSGREYGWNVTENESGQYILFEYFDTANATDSVTLTIHERFNKSNVIVDNATFTGTSNLVYQEPLTSNETKKVWMAEIYVDRGGTVSHFRAPITGARGSILPANLDAAWTNAAGIFALLVVGMSFTRLNYTAGAIATALAGGMLWQIGFLSQVATGPAVVLAIGIAVIAHYRMGGAP